MQAPYIGRETGPEDRGASASAAEQAAAAAATAVAGVGRDPGAQFRLKNSKKLGCWTRENGLARLTVGRVFPTFDDDEETWDKTLSAVVMDAPSGYKYLRRKHERLVSKSQEANLSIKNRWTCCIVQCEQSGQPNNYSQTAEDVRKRRRRSSKKIGCPFKVTVRWPRYGGDNNIKTSGVPRITQVHSLEHNHDAPGVVPATAAELSHIGELEDTIKTLAQKNVRPAEVYKFCAPEGKALSHDAKQKVRNLMRKFKDLCDSPADGAPKPITQNSTDNQDAARLRSTANEGNGLHFLHRATAGQRAIHTSLNSAQDIGSVALQNSASNINWDRLPGIAAEQLIADSNRADFVAFGREAAARAGQLRSRAAARRVIFHMKAALETALSAEEASESFEMVETAVISRGATNSQVATQDGNVTRLAIVEGAATRAGQQRQPMNDGRSGEARRSEAHTNQSYMIGTNVAAPLALPQGTRGVNGNPRNGSTEGLGLGAALMPPAGQQDARNQSAPSAFSSQSPSLSVAGPRTPFSWATPSRPGWQ